MEVADLIVPSDNFQFKPFRPKGQLSLGYAFRFYYLSSCITILRWIVYSEFQNWSGLVTFLL